MNIDVKLTIKNIRYLPYVHKNILFEYDYSAKKSFWQILTELYINWGC